MFRVPFRLQSLSAFSLAAALIVVGAVSASAADIEYEDAPPHARRHDPLRYEPPPYYGGPVYGRPPYAIPEPRERWGNAEDCRMIYRRSFDPYGREIVRRLRVCDEGVVERRRVWAGRPHYDDTPDVYRAPRPPRSIGPSYDDD